MALSATALRKLRGIDRSAQLILESAGIYKGSFMKLNGFTHGTSAHQGRVEVFDTDSGSIPFGLNDRAGTGTNNVLTGDESEAVNADLFLGSFALEAVAVTGASAQADVGKLVYLTDDDTLSLTRPTKGLANGIIVRYNSATSFDVLMFSVETIIAIALGGSAQENMFLGHYDFANVTDGNILTSFPMPYHGRILTLDVWVGEAFVGSGGTGLLNAEIDTVDVTGGVVTVSTANGGTAGAKIAGTAITALNVFHEGSVLDLEFASSGGTRTSGNYSVWAQVERLPGF